MRERIYAEQLSKLGADHIDTLATANELAVYHYNANQYDKALALEEKVLAARTTKLGADHPDTLTSMSNLASTYSALGQNDQALTLSEKVLAASTTKLGADHPDTLTMMNNLAVTHYKLRMYARAVPILEALIPKKFGREGESTAVLTSMALLVLCLDGVGEKPDFLLAYKPETQAAVVRLAPTLKTSLLKTTLK